MFDQVAGVIAARTALDARLLALFDVAALQVLHRPQTSVVVLAKAGAVKDRAIEASVVARRKVFMVISGCWFS